MFSINFKIDYWVVKWLQKTYRIVTGSRLPAEPGLRGVWFQRVHNMKKLGTSYGWIIQINKKIAAWWLLPSSLKSKLLFINRPKFGITNKKVVKPVTTTGRSWTCGWFPHWTWSSQNGLLGLLISRGISPFGFKTSKYSVLAKSTFFTSSPHALLLHCHFSTTQSSDETRRFLHWHLAHSRSVPGAWSLRRLTSNDRKTKALKGFWKSGNLKVDNFREKEYVRFLHDLVQDLPFHYHCVVRLEPHVQWLNRHVCKVISAHLQSTNSSTNPSRLLPKNRWSAVQTQTYDALRPVFNKK